MGFLVIAAPSYAAIHKNIKKKCHLNHSEIIEQNRAAALAEKRQFAASE